MTLLAEPEVKALLAQRGVAVPRGVTLAVGADPGPVVLGLRGPLVLKALAGGLAHKSDVGGVRLGLAPGDLPGAIDAMRAALDAAGIAPAGFLVEEQCGPGVELVVGAARGPYGVAVAVGLGGTLAELLDDVAVGLAPLSRADAEALLDGFRAAPALRGARGSAPVDRAALVDLLLAVAGDGGLVDELGDAFAELDCNPVIARPDGATVVDASLVLRDVADTAAVGDAAIQRPSALATHPLQADFDALFAPRTVAVAGASTTRPGFGNRALAAYRANGWDVGLVAIHPTAREIDGVPAHPSVGAVPGGVDYLLAAVPAAACVDLVRDAAGHARIVQVVSGGFSEAGADGRALEADLVAAARAAGLRVVGPNCIGVYAPAGRQTFLLDVPADAGTVSVVSQSGGLAGDIVKVGAARGLRFAKVASIGNSVDVTPAELVEHLVGDAATRLIGCYLEGARDGERLVDALRAARGVKPVVVMAGGLSAQGARAAVSHTGTLTGDRRVWHAVARASGAAVVERLEDLLGALVLVQRYADADVSAGAGPDVLVVGVGGGASVLATDACDRAGLAVAPLADPVTAALRSMGHGAGTSVVNPIEIGVGPAAPPDVFLPVLDAVLGARVFPDVLLHVNVQSYYGYGDAGTGPLCTLVHVVGDALRAGRFRGTRVALVARNLEVAPGPDAEAVVAAAVAADLPLYRTFDEAAVAIAAVKTVLAARREDGA